MIADNISNIDFYIKNFPKLKDAFEFLKRGVFADGKTELNSLVKAAVETSYAKPVDLQKLETHAKFIDIHYTISGKDVIGWKNASECKNIFYPYDESKDIAFYNEAPDFDIILSEGKFAVFFPEDAHAPLKGKLPVKKCIMKINTEILKK
ncbi:YhcH/YjgK/YiaL family protein [Endomicrobium proavitum]|uniref:YhcH/YjgK/YiaL family protein n=1 Tax=Endomicrobium proavitum TaxID=1408281 RepID=A0A0G3WGH5_9BACT|nr:YhcH/YjgK/YiaL family protein [Endomicrobium proavitum]AKL97781.1 hypothetical protein Epro_0402 [Endomicrobium proavitum]